MHKAHHSEAGAVERLTQLPRVRLAHLPTPLEEMPRLSAYLGGPKLLVKRDDCTGLGWGGNKLRKLEYIGLVRSGRFTGQHTIIWLHTGGTPGLFAYPSVMAQAAGR